MKISFFEEFPSQKVLEKCNSIRFPFKLILADYSFESFKLYENDLKKNDYCKDVIYWLLLHKKDGYWFSDVANYSGMQKIFEELKLKRTPIMLDFEFPIDRKLIWKNFFKRKKSRRLIDEFFSNYKGEIYACEYFPRNKMFVFLQKFFGLYADIKKFENVKKIKMLYTSMHYFPRDFLQKELEKYVKEYGDKLIIGLGTISHGINGNEAILSAADLKEDLWLCKICGVKEVVIYQLEGLNEGYLSVLREYI